MPRELKEVWHAATRLRARIAFLYVLTAQKPNTLGHQTELIQHDIDSWILESGLDVDTVYAGREASIVDEDRFDHPAGDLWRMWMRTMVLCDIVIAHAHSNGSAALGEFLAKAVDAPHGPAVIVIVPEDTPVSKAWRGQFDHHPNVRFVDVMGDGGALARRLCILVHDVLDSRKAYLLEGPRRRQDLELALEGTARQLRRYWHISTQDVRTDVLRRLQLSGQHFEDHLEDPLLLASLGFAKTIQALQMLVPEPSAVVQVGHERLSVDAMRAWEIWQDDPGVELESAVWHLRRAIDAKGYSDAGVSRPIDLTSPALWDLYAGTEDGEL